jgi:hypothetical protein
LIAGIVGGSLLAAVLLIIGVSLWMDNQRILHERAVAYAAADARIEREKEAADEQRRKVEKQQSEKQRVEREKQVEEEQRRQAEQQKAEKQRVVRQSASAQPTNNEEQDPQSKALLEQGARRNVYSPCLRQSYETCCNAYGEAELKPVSGVISLSNHEVQGFKVHIVYVNQIAEFLLFSKKTRDGRSAPPSPEEKSLLLQANSFGRNWQRRFGDFWVLDTPETIMANGGSEDFHISTALGNQAKQVQLDKVSREIKEYARQRGFQTSP